MGRSLRVEADGGSRGNPGVAGYGALVRDADTGELLVELAAPLGRASNNVAEYRGMLAGLGAARLIDPAAEVEVAMDSKLVVEQMAGRWKIKHPDMRALALEGRDLAAEITAAGGAVTFTWVPRAENAQADALSNRGMDGEEVEDWRSQPPQPNASQDPGELPARAEGRGRPTRVVLVRHGGTRQAERAAAQVAGLVGDAPARVLTSRTREPETGTAIAGRLGVDAEVDPDWDEQARGESTEEFRSRVSSAWEGLVDGGGTVVVTCHCTPILLVLALVLGIPQEGSRRLAVAPGSLTAIEAWSDGESVVAFTNRT